MDDPVEDSLCPRGGPAVLLKGKWCHPLVQRLEIVALSLAINPALGLFFSVQFLGYTGVTVWILTSSQSSEP